MNFPVDMTWLLFLRLSTRTALTRMLASTVRFSVLLTGGWIVIRDDVMDLNRIYPRDCAIFAVNMLLGTSDGGTYTYEEIKTGLSQAGFAACASSGRETIWMPLWKR